MTEIGVLVAFVAGVASFASPCCLPLVPAYLSYMVGTADGASRRTSFTHGLAFVTGFSIVFVGFWASIGAIGYVFADHTTLLRQIGGTVLVVLGLQVAGFIDLPVLWRDTRRMPAFARTGMGGFGGGDATLGGTTGRPPARLGRSFLFGTVFAAGWSPCIGPILGAIIGLASVTASVAEGTVLLVAYAAGLAVPFLAISLGAEWVAGRLSWVGRHHHLVSKVTGLALIAVGLLMVTGTLAKLASLATPFGI